MKYVCWSSLIIGVASASCGGDFEPRSRVNGLRLLAVSADLPYAAPGTRVRLDALAYDTVGRGVSWGWGLCPDPVTTTAVGCIDELDWGTFEVRNGEGAASYELAIAADELDVRTPEARRQASVGVVVVACPGELSASVERGHTLATGAVPFTCRDRDTGEPLGTGDFAVGLKRVFVRESERNANPTIEGITWDGTAWLASEVKAVKGCGQTGPDYAACEADAHAVVPLLGSNAREVGIDANGERFSEQLVVEYYTAGGVFEHDLRIGEAAGTRWAAQRVAAGQSKIWIVVRDDRGGVSWTERTVVVD